MTVGEHIRMLRKERGLTQKQLGQLSGINESQIRRYELGLSNSNPKLETLQKIADALNVNVLHLLYTNELQPPEDNNSALDDWLHYYNIELLQWDIEDEEEGWLIKFTDTKEMFFLPQQQAEQLPLLGIEYVKSMVRTFGEKVNWKPSED